MSDAMPVPVVDEDQERASAHRLVQLRFKPLWLYLDSVREFCSFFARTTFSDPSLGHRVGVVVHELVENAVRHGDDRELDLTIEGTADEFRVVVRNTASDDQIEMLGENVRKLENTNPEQAYIEAMRAAVGRPDDESGLGLARVRHEGRVDLAFSAEGGTVSVTARGLL